MALYPPAVKRLIARHNQARMVAHNRVNLHVAVSEARSLHGFFTGAPVCSHFYVAKDGRVEQYIDTTYRSKADLDGNDATISIETQGGLRNAQTEPWTDAQVRALAALFAWASRTHGIPMRLATDSRPGESSRGLSWHRLGIDPWRVSGGMKYSSSRGKVCPGNAKIAQIPTILALAAGASLTSAGQAIPTVDITLPGGSLPGDLTKVDITKAHPVRDTPTLEEDDMERAIIGLYEKHLGRTPARTAVNHWIDVWAQAEPGAGLAAVRDGIAGSEEAKEHAVVVAYRDILGRDPSKEDIATHRQNTGDNIAAIRAALEASAEAKARKRDG